jgi:ribonuclease P protein component
MSPSTRYTFKKNERLTHQPTIDQLFQTKGKRLISKPLSLIYRETKLRSDSPCQLLISVPKKKFKRAVHRNRIKRLIREAYRQEKHKIYAAVGESKQFALAIVYLTNEMPELPIVKQAIGNLINDFSSRIS